MTAALDSLAPGGKASQGYRGFLDLSARLDDISQRYFFWRSIGSVRDMFDPTTAASLSTLGDVLRMRPWSTVGATIRTFLAIQWFAFLCNALGRPSTWKGRPYSTPGTQPKLLTPRARTDDVTPVRAQ